MNGDRVLLLASAVRLASGVGPEILVPGDWSVCAFRFSASAYTTNVGDEFSIWVQQSWDGVQWDDLVSWKQAGSGFTDPERVASVPRWRSDQAGEGHTLADATTAAGVVNTLVGERFRVKWLVVQAGVPAPSYTFEVVAYPRRVR